MSFTANALCIGKICASAWAVRGALTAAAPAEHAKEIFEALMSGGEQAQKLRGAETEPLRKQLEKSRAVVKAAYDDALKNSHSAGYREKVEAAFANLNEIFDECMPCGQALAALNHDPQRIGKAVADAAAARAMDAFAEGEGRKLLIGLVALAYEQTDKDAAFMQSLARVNWKENFERLHGIQAGIGRVEAGQARAETAAAENAASANAMLQEVLQRLPDAANMEAPLRAVLQRLGETDVPLPDIPARLAAAVDELLKLRADLNRLRNDRPEFAAIRRRALAFIDKGEFDAARAALQEGRAAARALREEISRTEASFLAHEARIDILQLNYDPACAKLAEATRLDPDTVWIWGELGDLWVMRGLIAKAGDAFRGALAAAERNGDSRDLSVSYERLGNLAVAAGDGKAARDFFDKCLAVRKTLAEADPGNAGFKRDLSVSYNKMGDLAVAAGDGKAARDFFDKSLAVAKTLAEADPGNAVFQRDLSVSYIKMGELAVAAGDGKAARDFFDRRLAVAKTLAEADPGNAGFQRDLSISYNKIGDLAVAAGDGKAARDFFARGLAIAETLAAGDPGNAEFQRDLSISYNKMGDLAVAARDGKAARDLFAKSLAVRKTLAEADPGNAEFQRDLSVSYNKMGNLAVAAGDGKAAREFFARGLAIAETLAAGDPGNAGFQRDLIVSRFKLSKADPAAAMAHLTAALKIARRLAAQGRLAPKDAWMPEDLERRLKAAGG